VESAIKRFGDKDVRWSAQGMLRLMPTAMQRLYRPTLDAIKDAISRILDEKSIQGYVDHTLYYIHCIIVLTALVFQYNLL